MSVAGNVILPEDIPNNFFQTGEECSIDDPGF